MRDHRWQYRQIGVVVHRAARQFLQDECFILSASIAYYFLLSIIPFAALTIIFFNLAAKGLYIFFDLSFHPGSLLIAYATEIFPFLSSEGIETYVVHPEASRSFTIFGLIGLPIISSLIFMILERVYRRIFRLPPRHLLVRQMISPILVLVAILFLFILNFAANVLSPAMAGIIGLSSWVPAWSGDIVAVFFAGPGELFLHLVAPVVFVLTFLGTTAVFVNVNIRFANKLLAALLFYLLWLAAKFLFSLYVSHVSSFSHIYGPLSSVVMVLLWVYYSAGALLFSLEILYQLHLANPVPEYV